MTPTAMMTTLLLGVVLALLPLHIAAIDLSRLYGHLPAPIHKRGLGKWAFFGLVGCWKTFETHDVELIVMLHMFLNGI